MGGRVIPFGVTRGPQETRDRLLDAAEALFMEHGFEATSLRAITAAAGANLAAVNYHFGGKEALFEAVLTRRLDPMNQERVALLTELENRGGAQAIGCEQILSAMLIPAIFDDRAASLSRVPSQSGQVMKVIARSTKAPMCGCIASRSLESIDFWICGISPT